MIGCSQLWWAMPTLNLVALSIVVCGACNAPYLPTQAIFHACHLGPEAIGTINYEWHLKIEWWAMPTLPHI